MYMSERILNFVKQIDMYSMVFIRINNGYSPKGFSYINNDIESIYEPIELYNNSKSIEFILEHILDDTAPKVSIIFNANEYGLTPDIKLGFGEMLRGSNKDGYKELTINNEVELRIAEYNEIYKKCCLKIKDIKLSETLLKYIL